MSGVSVERSTELLSVDLEVDLADLDQWMMLQLACRARLLHPRTPNTRRHPGDSLWTRKLTGTSAVDRAK